ncbi:F0F1 ATP synthase subunit alpha [Candidatus Woesebacteria bacterium]|nr:F0F1 ATP synthase subunit alpha [Candidatus Woesebacteria bacterium]
MTTQFEKLLEQTGEYGIVYEVRHPIVLIEGLPNVKAHEVILFEGGKKAEVSTINRGKVEARVFSDEPIKVGTKVTRTDNLLSVPVGKELLGQVVNPLGEPFDETENINLPENRRSLDIRPIGISGRHKVQKQLVTGIAIVDLLLPIGKGQRELVIGDKKTGKTSLLLTAVKEQVKEGAIVIYAAIGKKKSEVKRIKQFLEKENLLGNIVIVATSSFDSPSLIFQTPYSAMSIAEYFRDEGIDTLLILDDMSTHANFYRELSLLSKRFPGRDSYPGDIFYVHSRLLERAGNFKHEKVEQVAITCLPVVQLVEGDFAGYIPTNLMGITDGHIFLDSDIYYEGRRPAVNIHLSVTRVGRQTLSKLSREINKTLLTFLTRYDRIQDVSHFGQELTEDVRKALELGKMVYVFFNQHYQETIPMIVQLIIISMLFHHFIENEETLSKAKTGLISAYDNPEKRKFLIDLANTKDLNTFNENVKNNKENLFSLFN